MRWRTSVGALDIGTGALDSMTTRTALDDVTAQQRTPALFLSTPDSRNREMKATCLAVLISLCATEPSFANPTAIYLSCDIVVRQYGKGFSNEPTDITMDVIIEGSGKSLSIKSTGNISGASFYAIHSPHIEQEIENRSNDAMWDVAVRQYEKAGALSHEDRLLINRYIGSIRIKSKSPPAGLGASSEGTCKRHTEKKF